MVLPILLQLLQGADLLLRVALGEPSNVRGRAADAAAPQGPAVIIQGRCRCRRNRRRRDGLRRRELGSVRVVPSVDERLEH